MSASPVQVRSMFFVPFKSWRLLRSKYRNYFLAFLAFLAAFLAPFLPAAFLAFFAPAAFFAAFFAIVSPPFREFI